MVKGIVRSLSVSVPSLFVPFLWLHLCFHNRHCPPHSRICVLVLCEPLSRLHVLFFFACIHDELHIR